MMKVDFRLQNLSPFLKKALFFYFILTSLAFGIAALMSYDRYQLDHQKTVQYYLGDPADGEDAFQKPYSQLIGVSHVHSYMMPLVFLVVWLALSAAPLSSFIRNFLMMGGVLSILIYNAAPYALRYGSERSVSLFTLGGIGLFSFYLLPVLVIVRELFRKNSLREKDS